MPDIPTGDNWSFSLDGSHYKSDPPTLETSLAALIDSPDRWEQYNDKLLYDVEVSLRNWMTAMLADANWKKSWKRRRYTAGMAFERLYGRPWDNDSSIDHKVIQRLSRLLNYYSSKIIKESSINGKKIKKTIYVLSYKKLSKRPYGLKLRLEWMNEQGIIPCRKSMDIPKRHPVPWAENRGTRKNQEARSRRAKDRYNERYNRHRKES